MKPKIVFRKKIVITSPMSKNKLRYLTSHRSQILDKLPEDIKSDPNEQQKLIKTSKFPYEVFSIRLNSQRKPPVPCCKLSRDSINISKDIKTLLRKVQNKSNIPNFSPGEGFLPHINATRRSNNELAMSMANINIIQYLNFPIRQSSSLSFSIENNSITKNPIAANYLNTPKCISQPMMDKYDNEIDINPVNLQTTKKIVNQNLKLLKGSNRLKYSNDKVKKVESPLEILEEEESPINVTFGNS